ncbi:MAG: glutathione peroxidase [Bryobacteraceae bacterium]
MKHILALLATAAAVIAPSAIAQDSGGAVKSFYELKTTYLDGKPADLAAFQGKVTLVVNVASRCGFTPQYEGLEKLHREMSGKAFDVLGFPSNDFGGQEPGTPAEIAAFCKRTYDVSFPMFSKVVTKATSDQSPIYRFLGASGHLPQWNFSKYVIDKNGQVVAFFPSAVKPDAPELRNAIEKALGE